MAADRNKFLWTKNNLHFWNKHTWASQLIVFKVVDQRPCAGVPRNPWMRRIRMQLRMFQNMEFQRVLFEVGVLEGCRDIK